MTFSFWNLLVVLCFVILYLGVALVFVQLRRLRDELHHLSTLNATEEKPADDSRTCAEIILRRLTSFETNMTTTLEAIPAHLKSDLESIQGELRFLAQPSSGGMSNNAMERQSSSRGGGGSGKDSDAYREARLLLVNGVDEERVVSETGLAVEEVSLLKRMISQNGQTIDE
ncbi:MAG: hypothetical protein HQL72_12500 [Magnetococcales bacterium]|nr:hypothetical protein [Magnetococcales bacterium]